LRTWGEGFAEQFAQGLGGGLTENAVVARFGRGRADSGIAR
jgi:hypothetical protein